MTNKKKTIIKTAVAKAQFMRKNLDLVTKNKIKVFSRSKNNFLKVLMEKFLIPSQTELMSGYRK